MTTVALRKRSERIGPRLAHRAAVALVPHRVDDGHLGSLREKLPGHGRPDEAGAAGHEDAERHGYSRRLRRRGRTEGLGGGRVRLRLLGLVARLDARPLPVPHEPLEGLGLVDTDEDVVDGLEQGRIVDELRGRPVAVVDLLGHAREARRNAREVLHQVAGELLVADELREEAVPRREVLREAGEPVGRRLERLDHREEFPLPLGVSEERRDEPFALAGPLLDGAEDLPEGGHRALQLCRDAVGERLVGDEAADEPLPRAGVLEEGVRRGDRLPERARQLLALRGRARELADEPLPLLHAGQDRLQRLGDGADVVDEVARPGEDLLELASANGRDLRAGLGERLVG